MALKKNNEGLSKIFIIGIFVIIALILGGVVWTLIGPGKVTPPKDATLTIWGVWDESSDLSGMINAYRKVHPYVKIKYVKIRYDEYEDMLLNAWATDTGPDIYALPNSWIAKYKDNFITPMPKSTSVAYYSSKKTLFKTETIIEYKTESSYTAGQIDDYYIDVVYDDVVFNNYIYALPFGINTLVMYVNRELMNQALLIDPPTTWDEFTSITSRFALIDAQNNIVRAAAALGTYENVPHAADIVTLLMLQNGTQMTSGNKVTFHQSSTSDSSYYPGTVALDYYTSFADSTKRTYTWNSDMPDAIDYFADGKLAFLFAYNYDRPEIESKASGVDFEIAPIPQVDPNNTINYANYWAYTVSKKSKNSNIAWNFLRYSSYASRVEPYLANTKQASVLQSTLKTQLDSEDNELKIFAQQALTAQSWYHGQSPKEAEDIFKEMIQGIVEDQLNVASQLRAAAEEIQSQY